eukprot:scaffold191800_cov40-Prasinocladus_malaysianus.AAC.1
MQAYIDECERELEVMMEGITATKARDEFLREYCFLAPPKDFQLSMRAYIWPRDMMATFDRTYDK